MTKEIELTQGKVALIDDEDYEELNQHKWCAHKIRSIYYAYRSGKPRGKNMIYMHRQILGLVLGDGKIVDHINRNPLDNRRENLRIVSQAQNLRNTGLARNNKSGCTGVSWDKKYKKWCASLSIHLGRFDNIDDAIEARRKAELKYWGGCHAP